MATVFFQAFLCSRKAQGRGAKVCYGWSQGYSRFCSREHDPRRPTSSGRCSVPLSDKYLDRRCPPSLNSKLLVMMIVSKFHRVENSK